ncbi:MAG: dihydroorotate dehydrogenase [Actinomycetia bacterium]|nr:dihydroorotate dehydrogenase [Actinomycetes bacterium]MCP4226454.1 dihydroorotate dehydrogenase [Actinomycetes bacterium]MCP5034595.1 dihydroorotate dehydrogenase [Actinomycetes bacterium]
MSRRGHSRASSVTPDLTTRVGSIELPSPIMTASGTAGHGAELGAYVDLGDLGAVVVKSLAHFAWDGNPSPRVHATPSGMINSVGLQGPGVSAWIDDELPALRRSGARVVVSIWGKTVDDYAKAAELIAPIGPEVIAVEVNISCPNTESGNELFAHSATMTETVLAATDGCRRPRWAKLSPNIGPGLADIAGAAEAGGAEAVTVANTYFGLSIDPSTGRPRLGGIRGGVSGPAIRPLAVRAVADVHAAHPELPIIGVGGIATVEDIIEFAMVGACAVQIGTANLADPRSCGRLGTDLVRWCAIEGVRRFDDLVGSAKFDG